MKPSHLSTIAMLSALASMSSAPVFLPSKGEAHHSTANQRKTRKARRRRWALGAKTAFSK